MNANFFVDIMWGLGRTSLQASVLVLMVLLVQQLFRRQLSPRWRCALWLLVMARVCLPISLSSGMSVFNLLPQIPALDEGSTHAELASHPTMTLPGPNSDLNLEWEANLRNALQSDPSAPVVLSASHATTAPSSSAPISPAKTPPRLSWPILLLCLWLTGVITLAAGVTIMTLRLHTRLAKSSPITDRDILELFESCRRQIGLKASPTLAVSAAIHSPALYGFFKPRLLLPAGLTDRLSPDELRFIFLHELAHLKRWDLPLNWLVTVLQILHWFNPLLWLGFARWRTDRELACDALVLETAGAERNKEYGRTMLHLMDICLARISVPGLVGILENKRQLHQRIDLIANFRPAKRWNLLSLLLLIGLALISLTDATPFTQAKSATISPLDVTTSIKANEPAFIISNPLPVSSSSTSPSIRKPTANTATIDVPNQGRDTQSFTLRLYRVDAPALSRKLQRQLGVNDLTQPLNLILFQYFATIGNPLGPSSSAWFNKRTGLLLCRNSLANLARFERDFITSMKTLRTSPPQVVKTVKNSSPTSETAQPYTRKYSIDPNTFVQNMESVWHPITTSPVRFFQDYVRQFFTAVTGIRFDTETIPQDNVVAQRSFILNDRAGILSIRATREELDTVETLLQFLNTPPPQITIRATFVEIPEAEATTLGYDWLAKLVKGENPTNYVRLTRLQSQEVLATLQHQKTVQVRLLPSVTTISGMDAQAENENYRTNVHALLMDPNVAAAITNKSDLHLRKVRLRSDGLLDAIPTLGFDDNTIHLDLKPSILHLRGGINPDTSETFDAAALFQFQKNQTNAITLLPCFRIHRIRVKTTLFEGQTVVLGGLPPVSSETRRFRELAVQPSATDSIHASPVNKHCLVFVTPVIPRLKNSPADAGSQRPSDFSQFPSEPTNE